MSESKTILSDEERKKQLEAELEGHKERFLQASRKGIEALQKDVSLVNWITSYPIEAATLAFLGGILLGAVKPLDRHRIRSLG